MRIAIDFDGVLCHTPFGRLAVHAPGHVHELPEGYATLYEARRASNPLRLAVEYARFAWRRMDPRAARLLSELSTTHEVTIVTGRSIAGEPLIARWLRRTGLDARVGLRMAPPGLRPAQHKLAVACMLGIDAHLDDDPRTAHYLAEHGVAHVYLLDHAGIEAHATAHPAHLHIVRSLDDFAAAANAVGK
jgi:hypothetical protein